MSKSRSTMQSAALVSVSSRAKKWRKYEVFTTPLTRPKSFTRSDMILRSNDTVIAKIYANFPWRRTDGIGECSFVFRDVLSLLRKRRGESVLTLKQGHTAQNVPQNVGKPRYFLFLESSLALSWQLYEVCLRDFLDG